MLLQETVLKSLVLGSIRSSGRIGQVIRPLINPHNLHIDAFYCQVVGTKGALLLTPEDIRDISPRGIVINDHEHLLDAADAIRLKPILDLNFEMISLKAYVGKKHVGTIEGYAIESESLFIQKIYVRPTLIRRINAQRLTFDRSQVSEVNSRAVTFKDSGAVKSSRPVLASKKLATPQTQMPSTTSLTKS